MRSFCVDEYCVCYTYYCQLNIDIELDEVPNKLELEYTENDIQQNVYP